MLLAGGALYALGLVVMGLSTSALGFLGGAGLLLGAAQSGTTYAVIYGVIGRNVAADKRSWAMGVTAAAGSFGQFLMVPVEGGLIAAFGWQEALFVLACAALMILPLAFGLREPALHAAPGAATQSMGAALREAFGDRSFLLLIAGYFVCGFQVVFIGVHLPSYLKDQGLHARRGDDGAGADRPVQRLRHLLRRAARRQAAQALPAVGDLRPALARDRRLRPARR